MEQAAIDISVREFRLFVERLLYQTKVPGGYIPALRDTILYAQAFAMQGLDVLLRDFQSFANAQLDGFEVREHDDHVVLDANGQHAWLVAPVAMDLALMELASGNAREIRIANVQWPAGLRVLVALAFRHTLRIEVSGEEPVVVHVTNRPSSVDPLMNRMLVDGLSIKADLWLQLYQLSSHTLTPDSQISRRHAGPVIVLPDGQLLGQQEDEDLDVGMMLGTELEQNGGLRAD